MNILKNKKIIISIIIFIILIILNIVSIFIQYNSRNNIKINGKEFLNIKDKICVYIDGAVKYPGMYKMKEGISLKECLDLIGGIRENADINNIDLNIILKNKEKINIPFVREDINYNEDNIIIDLNEATLEELVSLPGIGEKMANKIIEYRNKNKFEVIEDIMNVEGIGTNKFNEIKEYIIVN